jgi:acetyl-CoA/propionyl-CoA carboxylase, biotin carboxylase, biotin carboxyl carrier protein
VGQRIDVGSRITAHYDPLVAKLIVGASDRHTALRKLAAALDRLVIGGVRTNAGLHRWLVDEPEVATGRVTTRFLDETPLPAMPAKTSRRRPRQRRGGEPGQKHDRTPTHGMG